METILNNNSINKKYTIREWYNIYLRHTKQEKFKKIL